MQTQTGNIIIRIDLLGITGVRTGCAFLLPSSGLDPRKSPVCNSLERGRFYL